MSVLDCTWLCSHLSFLKPPRLRFFCLTFEKCRISTRMKNLNFYELSKERAKCMFSSRVQGKGGVWERPHRDIQGTRDLALQNTMHSPIFFFCQPWKLKYNYFLTMPCRSFTEGIWLEKRTWHIHPKHKFTMSCSSKELVHGQASTHFFPTSNFYFLF